MRSLAPRAFYYGDKRRPPASGVDTTCFLLLLIKNGPVHPPSLHCWSYLYSQGPTSSLPRACIRARFIRLSSLHSQYYIWCNPPLPRSRSGFVGLIMKRRPALIHAETRTMHTKTKKGGHPGPSSINTKRETPSPNQYCCCPCCCCGGGW